MCFPFFVLFWFCHSQSAARWLFFAEWKWYHGGGYVRRTNPSMVAAMVRETSSREQTKERHWRARVRNIQKAKQTAGGSESYLSRVLLYQSQIFASGVSTTDGSDESLTQRIVLLVLRVTWSPSCFRGRHVGIRPPYWFFLVRRQFACFAATKERPYMKD